MVNYQLSYSMHLINRGIGISVVIEQITNSNTSILKPRSEQNLGTWRGCIPALHRRPFHHAPQLASASFPYPARRSGPHFIDASASFEQARRDAGEIEGRR
jgi:hypothetical protein